MINDRIELTILRNLIKIDSYARRVIPFIEETYFEHAEERLIFSKIKSFIVQFNTLPSKEALAISVSNDKKIPEELYNTTLNYISTLDSSDVADERWLVEVTEKFCQKRALFNAVYSSIEILENKANEWGKLPKLLSDALAVTFNPHVGHDYSEDAESRWESYRDKEDRLPFGLKFFDKITKGGIPKKTLNVILAGTGVGKTLVMCHLAAQYFLDGKNVLYITLEMAEKRIAQRIDANILNTSMDDLETLPIDVLRKKMDRVKEKSIGKVIIKEYPTASANSTHFRALLNDLALKKNFVPDVVFIDYINIAGSSRLKDHTVNSYTYVKSIAEELRGMAVEYNVPIWTATQTNREGFVSSDVGLENTSESFGLPATADFMFALITSDELVQLNQLMVKQLKNRYGDVFLYKRFVIGIDRPKMRLYDLEDSAQEGISDPGNSDDNGGPGFDNTSFGQGMKAEKKSKFGDWYI